MVEVEGSVAGGNVEGRSTGRAISYDSDDHGSYCLYGSQ